MRLTRVAALVALFAPALFAQVPARQAAVTKGSLEADLYYGTGTDTWVSTNKPAYVALFDVSRTTVSMIYPTFSAQAEYPASANRRLISVPYSGFASGGMFGRSSLFSMIGYWGGRGGVGGWPHTLLLVASTSPLRVKNPFSTNLKLNHVLVQKQFLNLQADAGIESIIDLVRPLDPDAEMAYDRVDGIPARSAQYLALDGFGPRRYGPLLLNCANPQYFLTTGVTDAYLDPFCAPPLPMRSTLPINPPKDTAGTTLTTVASVNRKVDQSTLITDPADIRRFLEEHRSSDANGMDKVAGAALDAQGARQAARQPADNAVNVNLRQGDAAQLHLTPKPPTSDHPAQQPARVSPPPPAPTPFSMPAPSAPNVATAPSGPPAIVPIKP
jgi:hypothetical protein